MGFFFFLVSLNRDGVWLSCGTGKVGGCSLVPAGLEARPPSFLDCSFSPFPLLRMRTCSFSAEIPLFKEPGLGFAPVW